MQAGSGIIYTRAAATTFTTEYADRVRYRRLMASAGVAGYFDRLVEASGTDFLLAQDHDGGSDGREHACRADSADSKRLSFPALFPRADLAWQRAANNAALEGERSLEMTTDRPIDDPSTSEVDCKVCGCPESLHNVFSGMCSGGRCMCPGLITDEEEYEEFIEWQRTMTLSRL